MVDHNYYEAVMDPSADVGYKDLRDTINEYGARQTQRYSNYAADTDGWTEVVVDDWAYGPLLRLTTHGGNVCIGNTFCIAILHAGYVPWGFRPDTRETRSTEWMWYFRPIEDVVEGEFYDVKYALKNVETGDYILDENSNPLTFESKGTATAVEDVADGDYKVVEVAE